jgi:hypothetical protein
MTDYGTEGGPGATQCRSAATAAKDARLMPAKYVRLYSKGHKNEFGDYGREEPLIRDSGFRSVLVPSLDFIRCTFGQIRTDDHLRHQPIGAGRQTVSEIPQAGLAELAPRHRCLSLAALPNKTNGEPTQGKRFARPPSKPSAPMVGNLPRGVGTLLPWHASRSWPRLYATWQTKSEVSRSAKLGQS